jgi:glutathione S-transferase
MGRVPVLVHGDVVVTETAAICTYLAEQFPEAGLDVPIDSPDRGAYLRWLFFAPDPLSPVTCR